MFNLLIFLYVFSGTIRFFTEPPEVEKTVTTDSIVQSLSKPFSLDDDFKSNACDDEDMEEASSEDDDNTISAVTDSQMETETVKEQESAPTPRRITRSLAKQQHTPKVSFAVDVRRSSTMKSKKATRKSQVAEETISTDTKEKLGLVAPKKTIMKKIKKAKKKSAKSASELSDMVETLKF